MTKKVKYGRRKGDIVCTVCKTLCELCFGRGWINSVSVGEPPQSVVVFSGTVSTRACPHGCPGPLSFYTTYGSASILDARARSTRIHDL